LIYSRVGNNVLYSKSCFFLFVRKMKAKKLALIILIIGITATIGTTAVIANLPIVDQGLDDSTPLSPPASVPVSNGNGPKIDIQLANNDNENNPPNLPPTPPTTPEIEVIEDAPTNPPPEIIQTTETTEEPPPETTTQEPIAEAVATEPVEEVTVSEPQNSAIWPMLPSEYITLQVADGINSYFISTLSGVPPGYDVQNGVYPGWCVDKRFNIPRNTDVQVKLYSSLNPPADLLSQRWDLVNYILNNKQGSMQDIQDAIWYFVKMDGIGWWGEGTKPGAQSMIDDALTNGNGFVPGPGDVLAIICYPKTDTQITIIEIEVPERPCGLSPGFWKHNIRVALGYPGSYSVPHEGEPRITEAILLAYAGEIGVTLPEALEALTAKGPVSEAIRLDMANTFNTAAGYEPYSD
jgi:hypothetical protein